MSLNVIPLTGSIGAVVEALTSISPWTKKPSNISTRLSCSIACWFSAIRGSGRRRRRLSASCGASRLSKGTRCSRTYSSRLRLSRSQRSRRKRPRPRRGTTTSCYTPVPPKISILAAVTVPRGGDTMWCNQYEAYDRLSADHAAHDPGPARKVRRVAPCPHDGCRLTRSYRLPSILSSGPTLRLAARRFTSVIQKQRSRSRA